MPIILLAWSQPYFETATFTKTGQVFGRVAENLYYATIFEFPAVIIFTMLILRSMKMKCALILFFNCLVQVNTCMCDLNSEYVIIKAAYKQNTENSLLGINI